MENKKACIVVTWDFTKLSENALEHAKMTAKNIGVEIKLLHIVGKKNHVEEKRQELDEIVSNLKKNYSGEISAVVEEGTIFKTINKVAERENAQLVFMGTHGIKGLQKVTGSWALKVVVNSKIPFIVVQEPPKLDSYKKVLLVIDYKKENKQKMRWVQYLKNTFDSEFHVFKLTTKDKIFQQRIHTNEKFAQKFMGANGVKYTEAVSTGENDFALEIIEEAKKTEADLIIVMTTKNIGFADYALGAHEQYVIANMENIPVMCVNPDPDLVKYKSFH